MSCGHKKTTQEKKGKIGGGLLSPVYKKEQGEVTFYKLIPAEDNVSPSNRKNFREKKKRRGGDLFS